MATRETVGMYAMYVIGEVESHWNWTGVNYSDPITIGMMQWYGTRAAHLINRIKDATDQTDWNYLVANAPELTNDINAHADTSDWWTDRYLSRTEGDALKHIMRGDANHLIQQTQALADFDRYIDLMLTWGLSLDKPKQLIFTMSMYHQSPRRAGEVIRACGANATLSKLRSTCLNNSVLRAYPTRYNTVYGRLAAWDGVSMPPDFGQVDLENTADGGDGGTLVNTSELGYITKVGNDLILFGSKLYQKGVIFHAAAGARWVNANKPDTEPIPDEPDEDAGNDTDPTTAEQKLVDKMKSYIGTLRYSQGAGRLSPDTSGYSDCSALCWYVYKKITGKNIGTWTGAQVGKGRSIYKGATSGIVEADMRLGDLVLYWWSNDSDPSVVDHVEMYIGDGKVCGHGGGTGPTIKNSIGRGAAKVNIRRYL